jgi:hypothetical protein
MQCPLVLALLENKCVSNTKQAQTQSHLDSAYKNQNHAVVRTSSQVGQSKCSVHQPFFQKGNGHMGRSICNLILEVNAEKNAYL